MTDHSTPGPIPGAIPMARGCGASRSYGAIYVELGLSPHGTPMQKFLLDPPNYNILQGGLDISPIGMHLVQFAGIWHLFDHVGSEHYPNVADWLEETIRWGLSRRIQSSIDFSKLTRDSRLFMIHSKAYIENVADYPSYVCCTDKEHQHGQDDHCVAAVYNDLERDGTALVDAQTGQVERDMPSFSYRHMLDTDVPARCRPDGVKPQYKRAVFAKFPIGRLVVVGSPDDDVISRVAEKVNKTTLPWYFVDE